MLFECIPRRVGLVGNLVAMFAGSFTNDVVSLDDETHSITISVTGNLYLNASASTGVTRDLRWG